MTAVAETQFDAIADALLGEPGITEGPGFGRNSGLRVNGSIFAMLVDGELVVKLPRGRCEELTSEGAHAFQVGKREMREWVAVAAGRDDWPALAREALAFVRG